jgi:transcriptional regulator with XRE-family HTH domain
VAIAEAPPLVDRIASAVADAGLTQYRLAEILGCNQSGVSNRIRGKTAWRVNELDILARTLDVPLNVLLGAEPSVRSAGNRVSAAPKTGVRRGQISAGPTRRPKQPQPVDDLNGKGKRKKPSLGKVAS